MNKWTFSIFSIFLITTCASKPYVASSKKIDDYFKNIKLVEDSGLYKHNSHGELRVEQEPLSTAYENCKSIAFKDFSVKVGNHTVTDYATLHTIEISYISNLLSSLRLNKQKAYGVVPATSIFNDKKIGEEAFRIKSKQEEKVKCLKDAGWDIVRNKRN